MLVFEKILIKTQRTRAILLENTVLYVTDVNWGEFIIFSFSMLSLPLK